MEDISKYEGLHLGWGCMEKGEMGWGCMRGDRGSWGGGKKPELLNPPTLQIGREEPNQQTMYL